MGLPTWWTTAQHGTVMFLKADTTTTAPHEIVMLLNNWLHSMKMSCCWTTDCTAWKCHVTELTAQHENVMLQNHQLHSMRMSRYRTTDCTAWECHVTEQLTAQHESHVTEQLTAQHESHVTEQLTAQHESHVTEQLTAHHENVMLQKVGTTNCTPQKCHVTEQLTAHHENVTLRYRTTNCTSWECHVTLQNNWLHTMRMSRYRRLAALKWTAEGTDWQFAPKSKGMVWTLYLGAPKECSQCWLRGHCLQHFCANCSCVFDTAVVYFLPSFLLHKSYQAGLYRYSVGRVHHTVIYQVYIYCCWCSQWFEIKTEWLLLIAFICGQLGFPFDFSNNTCTCIDTCTNCYLSLKHNNLYNSNN